MEINTITSRWHVLDFKEEASLAALVTSGLIVALTVILPLVRLPQSETYHGPAIPYGDSTYTISGYYIPSVGRGDSIDVKLSGYSPGDVIFSLFPTLPDQIAPTGPSVISFERPAEANVSASYLSPATRPYGIYVVSYNKTVYTLELSSVWSPFYDFRIYTYPAVFALLASGFAFYYFVQTGPRRREEARVLKELRDKAKKNG